MNMSRAGLQSFLGRAAQLVESLWADEVTIASVAIPCAVSRSAVGGEMVLGGHIPEAILKVQILKSNLETAPLHGKTLLTFEGKEWRVDEVHDSNHESAWALTCVPVNKS
jgi:hypothetical protein